MQNVDNHVSFKINLKEQLNPVNYSPIYNHKYVLEIKSRFI